MPDFCNDADGERFKNMSGVEIFQSTLNKYPNARQLQRFLGRCKFKRCENGDSGTTWFELYVLYKMFGGTDGNLRPARAAMKRPSMEDYLRQNGAKKSCQRDHGHQRCRMHTEIPLMNEICFSVVLSRINVH